MPTGHHPATPTGHRPTPSVSDVSEGHRKKLRADCTRCFGLCCVVSAFAASADFAIDKAAEQPCPHLQEDFRCAIHDQLRPQGFPGCVVYDCFGAGQQVAQVTFGGRDWRTTPSVAGQMFRVFPIMRQLHELLWYLNEALLLPQACPLHGELHPALDETERLTQHSPDALLELDVAAHRHDIGNLLRRTSELVRADVRRPETDLPGTDLIGKNLHGADLKGANLRGAYLIGADLSNADLSLADLTGADCRATNLRGADLTTSIFLTQAQLDAATGDVNTKLPPSLTIPKHWPTAAA